MQANNVVSFSEFKEMSENVYVDLPVDDEFLYIPAIAIKHAATAAREGAEHFLLSNPKFLSAMLDELYAKYMGFGTEIEE
jgi:hypothetical protein